MDLSVILSFEFDTLQSVDGPLAWKFLGLLLIISKSSWKLIFILKENNAKNIWFLLRLWQLLHGCWYFFMTDEYLSE